LKEIASLYGFVVSMNKHNSRNVFAIVRNNAKAEQFGKLYHQGSAGVSICDEGAAGHETVIAAVVQKAFSISYPPDKGCSP